MGTNSKEIVSTGSLIIGLKVYCKKFFTYLSYLIYLDCSI